MWDLRTQKVKFGSKKAIFGVIWFFLGRFWNQPPSHPYLGKFSQIKLFFLWNDRLLIYNNAERIKRDKMCRKKVCTKTLFRLQFKLTYFHIKHQMFGKGTIYGLRLRDSRDSRDSRPPKTLRLPRLRDCGILFVYLVSIFVFTLLLHGHVLEGWNSYFRFLCWDELFNFITWFAFECQPASHQYHHHHTSPHQWSLITQELEVLDHHHRITLKVFFKTLVATN